MKKWADLKCDGKRRIVALRGPNGSNMRKKNLGPVERMVHKILMMSPQGGEEKRVNTVVKSIFLIIQILLLKSLRVIQKCSGWSPTLFITK